MGLEGAVLKQSEFGLHEWIPCRKRRPVLTKSFLIGLELKELEWIEVSGKVDFEMGVEGEARPISKIRISGKFVN